jgi:hydrogenase/urease accessory protein HupE
MRVYSPQQTGGEINLLNKYVHFTCAIVLGTMILAEVRPKLAVAIALVGIFAIFHGHAHGTELPAGQSGLL